MKRAVWCFATVLLGFAFNAEAQVPTIQAFPRLKFTHPVYVTASGAAADKSLYVVEQAGKILKFDDDSNVRQATTFLDITKLVSTDGTEEGLLGLAFDPAYADNGRYYVYYSAARPRRSVVARYPGGTILMEIAQPYSNHNGGMLAFGPDKMLYIGLGDGGSAGDPHNYAQDLKSLLGKILRIDPNGRHPYAIPADNPFVTSTNGARGEIWAYGLRNPWRFSFDRQTGALWAGDVGQNAWEEIDLITKGGNYGWRLFEATHPFNNPQKLPATKFIVPIHEYGHTPDGGFSITGGYVYRGTAVPALQGAYIYGDFVTGNVWALRLEGGKLKSNQRIATVPSIASFGENRDGELFIVDWNGLLWRFANASGI